MTEQGSARALRIAILGAFLWSGAAAQTPDRPVLHERLPRHRKAPEQGLVLDPSGAGTLPDAVRVGGEDIPAPDLEEPPPTGDEIVYRSLGEGETVEGAAQSVGSSTAPDRHTQREGMLYYHAVFDPSVVPFKRNNAKDLIQPDYSLEIGRPRPTPLEIVGNRLDAGRDAFWGSLLVELAPGRYAPIPSVSPESRILGYETAPGVGLAFFIDGAGNYFVRSDDGGRVRLNVLMDAPRRWFTRTIPRGITTADAWSGCPGGRPQVPRGVREVATTVWRRIGVAPEQPLDEALPRLVSWFRAFRPGDPPSDSGDIYLDLALGQVGVCRHRVHAFVITAQTLGIPARYVSNEAHVFAEVWIPGPDPGWLRLDLGGGADGLTVFGGDDRRRHVPDGPDPFPTGGGYDETYSYQAMEGEAGASQVQGLPPRQRLASRDPGAGDEALADPALPRALRMDLADRRAPTRIALDALDVSVYRGESLPVAGQVLDTSARGVAGLQVVFLLVSPVGEAKPRKLGGTLTGPDGRFAEAVPIPQDLPTGTWRLVIQHMGDGEHAPARAE